MAGDHAPHDALEPELTIAADFPETTLEAWRAAALESLAGKPLDALSSRTREGIAVYPLYTWEDAAEPAGLPGFPPFVRGCAPLGSSLAGWEVCQRCEAADPMTAVEQVRADLDAGAQSTWLRLDGASRRGFDPDHPRAGELGDGGLVLATAADLKPLLALLRERDAGLHLDPGGSAVAAAALVLAAAEDPEAGLSWFAGSLGADPLGTLVADGELPAEVDACLDRAAGLAAWVARNAPRLRTLSVSTVPYHAAGATAVQELAFALATGVEYLRAMERSGLDLDTAASQIRLVFAVGRDLFTEVATLRAARRLWADVVRACGGCEAVQAAPLHAVSSPRTLTTRDPWVNLLRVTVETFAAAAGGADVVTALPFDAAIGPPSELGRRVAATTHAILREESHLHRVVDPAGGSWYVERLTEEVARAAWAQFQEIEAGGGMAAFVAEGRLHAMLAESAAALRQTLATRREPVTGVSSYPLLAEAPLERRASDSAAARARAAEKLSGARESYTSSVALGWLESAAASGRRDLIGLALEASGYGASLGQLTRALHAGASATRVGRLAVVREAAGFEELRAASDRHLEACGARPRAFLVTVGPAAEHRARTGFAQEVLAAGGIEALTGDGCATVEDAVAAFAASGAPLAVICASDARHPEVVPGLAAALKGAGARAVVLAGRPGPHEAAFRTAGVDRFVYLGCDLLAELSALHAAAGVGHG